MVTVAEAIDALSFDLGTPSFPVQDPINGDSDTASAWQFDYQYATAQPTDLFFATFSGWQAMSVAEKQAFSDATDYIESLLNVDFFEVSGQSDPTMNVGEVALSGSTAGTGGFYQSIAIPGGGDPYISDWQNFTVFDTSASIDADLALILHEVGHALGLKHPFSGSPTLPAAFDNNKYTVMSYDANPDNGLETDGYLAWDIAALQARWGANLNTATGDDTYTGKRNSTVDVIWDAGGTDTFDASANTNNVTLHLGEGKFSKFGSYDDVSIAYGVVIENAIGGSGNDTIFGNSADNVLSGGAGNDILRGVGGNDTINGGDGIDLLRGLADDDMLNGDDGNDRIFGDEGADTMSGGIGNDYMNGGVGNDEFSGGAGDDRMFGDEGADIMMGDAGNDYMKGGTGNDDMNGGAGEDKIFGEDGDDVIMGGAGNDNLNGGVGNDELHGGDGDDVLLGRSGEDIIYGDAGNDNLRGDSQTDQLYGGDDDDYIDASGGNDTLDGGAGNDVLKGSTGVDLIIGGTGNDRMDGGTQADTFVFDVNHGSDRIRDWEIATDKIDFSNNGNFNNFASDVVGAMTDLASGHLRIKLDANNELFLLNTLSTDLSASDFIF